jgi:ABC-2 type transport system permease protein
MDIIKLGTDWARAEVFSAKIVWLFSLGLFLVAVGAGLYGANNPRIARFENEAQLNPKAFISTEIQRTAKSQHDLTMVFKILPGIIIVAAVVIMLAPGAAAFLMVVDSNTTARNDDYHTQLLELNK